MHFRNLLLLAIVGIVNQSASKAEPPQIAKRILAVEDLYSVERRTRRGHI